ncbi:hypothetical protein ACIBTV_29895 [Micromonospora sp. NPDC049366]
MGKIAKFCQDRRASEIRVLGELIRQEQRTALSEQPKTRLAQEGLPPR